MARHRGRPVRVVVVDDDELNRRRIASLLAEDDCIEIVTSLTNRDARGQAELWEDVDVVLVDAAGERDAVAVVEEVRQVRSPAQTTIIVITGHFFDDALRRRMREARADFSYHRAELGDARSLREAVLRPVAVSRPGAFGWVAHIVRQISH